MQLGQILRIRALGDDQFEGDGPEYPWGGLYGGQLIAQAIVAAGATVDEGRRVHSLHAHFIRRGENGAPVQYRVERERDGGSFSTRLVHAYQGDRRLLAATLSFTTEFGGSESPRRDLIAVPAAQDLSPTSFWFSQFERRGVPERTHGRLSSAAWFQLQDEIEASPIQLAAALAFLTDDLPTESVMLADANPPSSIDEFFSASLDHCIWFHTEIQPQDWLFMDFDCAAKGADRGLARGQVLSADGQLIANVSQEVLLRRRRPV